MPHVKLKNQNSYQHGNGMHCFSPRKPKKKGEASLKDLGILSRYRSLCGEVKSYKVEKPKELKPLETGMKEQQEG